MFYSDTLLSKTAPLAKVWLAANIERKLTKTQVLHAKIGEDCGYIIHPESAGGGPIALRLSGQLLLGVVRIYSRKARYLLDDCNEALLKIKMAFRPGNVDLPANQSHAANPASLTLPDVITEIDLLAPMPDPDSLFAGTLDMDVGLGNTTVADWDHSQFLSGSIEQARAEQMETVQLDDEDLNIDFGEDLDVPDLDTSIHQGRDAPSERPPDAEFGSSPKPLVDDDLELDVGDDLEEDHSAHAHVNTDLNLEDVDIDLGDSTEMGNPLEDLVNGDRAEEQEQRERESLSPLSSIRSSVERDLEQTFQDQNTMNFEPQEEEEESLHHAHKAKRRKVLHADADTELNVNLIREQQADRSRILKPTSFLPRDPMLLALMNMQKTGGFVSSILGDGRSRGWAPELRGILSLEVVARSGQLKRKRDSGVADLETEEEDADAGPEKTPQLEFQQDESMLPGGMPGIEADTTIARDEEEEELVELEDEEAFSPMADNFDDTTAPLLHPADSGPVSLGTKHAVHLLREKFGEEAEHSESIRQKSSVLFQDMLPEATTTRADATKMFFEVLVLATKDAIKVEQPADELGGPLRIRGKRGLWGSWAETQASGQLASQAAPASTSAQAEA
jgi:cohesin complex subunit SCC1